MLLFGALAWATTVYLNGVRVDVLPDLNLEGVDVRLDSAGNVWITAPRHTVRPVTPAAPPATGSPAPADPAPTAVPAGTWWLVTVDESGGGAVVDVIVNGVTIRRVRSGEPQLLLDLAPYLRRGRNDVRFSVPAGTVPQGGPLTLYVGRGSTAGGTVRIEKADIRYVPTTPTSPAGSTWAYTLDLP